MIRYKYSVSSFIARGKQAKKSFAKTKKFAPKFKDSRGKNAGVVEGMSIASVYLQHSQEIPKPNTPEGPFSKASHVVLGLHLLSKGAIGLTAPVQ